MDFTGFPKIARLNREVIVTEKIDGTNGQLLIVTSEEEVAGTPLVTINGVSLYAGSRNRFITPESDNNGFAKWALANAEELISRLGLGQHFGEWWGAGIQRRYGLADRRGEKSTAPLTNSSQSYCADISAGAYYSCRLGDTKQREPGPQDDGECGGRRESP